MFFSLILSPFTLICILMGFIYVVAGWIMYKYPPKKINGFYGYRTPASKKSQARWDFAQIYGAKEMMKTGLYMAGIGFLGFVLPLDEFIATMGGLILGLILTGVMLYRVERGIKKEFED